MLCPLVASLIAFGCQPSADNAEKQSKTENAKPRAASSSPSLSATTEPSGPNEFNDTARFIAGMPPEPGSAFADRSSTPEWKKYAASFDKSWAKLDATRLVPMRKWANEELRNASDKTTVFYPFSGPDILHALTFFPSADKYVLVALEPVGTVPAFKELTPEALDTYFATVARSLDSLLSFSFFKTDDMKVDVKKDLEGTVPILMLFLERTGNRIEDIKSVEISPAGDIVPADSSTEGTRVSKGIDILFSGADGRPRHTYYFSVNVHNDYLKKSPFRAYMAKMGPVDSYLKSASYLMHKDYFSAIRDAILDHSTMLVQDDSGIPYHFIKPDKWDVTLYGVYSSPIAMFKEHKEQDLADAYKESAHVKPLPFGIGYNWRVGQSNLLVARKIGTERD
jgi:hypothetical protein